MAIFEKQRRLWSDARRMQQRRRRQETGRSGRLRLEALETRLAPAVSTWLGALDNFWSHNANWDVPPAAGNDLVFPAIAGNLANTNDLAPATGFGSIALMGSGYTIGGNAITVTGGIDAAQATGGDTLNLPITLGGSPTVTVVQGPASLVLGGAISGSGGLTKVGAGSVDLTGANDYTGTTTIAGGEMFVDSTQGGSPVSIDANATLAGSGTVGAITSNSGIVSPGAAAPAVLTDGGDLNLGSGSSFNVLLDGTSAGSGYSQLAVAGQVNLNGATLNPTAGFTPTPGARFTIINPTNPAVAVNGTFANQPQGSQVTISGQPYRIDYAGGDGNDVVLTALAGSTTTVTPSATSIVFGQAVTLTANVTPMTGSTGTPTGMVQFFNGPTPLGSNMLVNGVATLTGVVLPAGLQSVTATYQGDPSFASSPSPADIITVSQSTTSTMITLVTPNPSGLGQQVSLSATVAPVSPGAGTPTGMVQFFTGGTTSLGMGTLSGGVATLATSALPLGVNSITATYEGDPNFSMSNSAAVTATVNQASTTTLTANPTSVIAGQTVTLSAAVTATNSGATGAPAGNVQFFNGSVLLGSSAISAGTATLQNVTLPAGANMVTAQFTGGNNFASSVSAPVAVTVTKADSTTTVTTTPNPSNSGQSVTLTATVAGASNGVGTPTGSVQFFNGTTSLGTATLSSGIATLLTTAIKTTGANPITAQYAGDSNYNMSTSPAVIQTINPGTVSSMTTVSASPSPSVTGQVVTLTSSITPGTTGLGTPTGSVQFFSGSTSLGTADVSNGVATLTTTALATGISGITARYSGDSTYAASNSVAISFTVNPANTTTTLTTSPNPSSLNQPATLTATVAAAAPGSGTPTGSVQFFSGTTSLGTAALNNGVATLSTSTLTTGADSITARYVASTGFNASTSNAVVQNVATAGPIVNISVSKTNPVANEPVKFTATVSAGSGTTVPIGTVNFFSDGMLIGSGTLNNGTATLVTTLDLGGATTTAVYAGDTNFSPASSLPLTFRVGDNNQLFLNQIYLDLFHTPIDPQGLNDWGTALTVGDSRAQVVNGILSTPGLVTAKINLPQRILGAEAATIHGNNNALVNALYQAILGRQPSAKEHRSGVRLVRQPAGVMKLVHQLFSTREFYANSFKIS